MCPKHASVFYVWQMAVRRATRSRAVRGINQVTVDGAGPPDGPEDDEADHEQDANLLSRR